MRALFSLFGFARQFQTDLQILTHGLLTHGRFHGGPSISDRAVALDRIAGSTFLVCVAGALTWLASQALPMSGLLLPGVTDSAQAATYGASDPDFQELGAKAAAERLTAAEIRQLQSRLQLFGFNPGVIDGIAGRRTLDALNRYRAAKSLNRISLVDRSAAADLLN